MDEKKYTTKDLYIGVISRQTSKQHGNFWGLLNQRYCILIKETSERYRCVLTDGIYAVSSTNTSNRDVINARTILPLIEFKPKLKNNQYTLRSEIYNLEETELKGLFKAMPRFEEFRDAEMHR